MTVLKTIGLALLGILMWILNVVGMIFNYICLIVQAVGNGVLYVIEAVGEALLTLIQGCGDFIVSLFQVIQRLIHKALKYVWHLWRRLVGEWKHEKEVIVVSGKGCIIFPLAFAPTKVHAKFTHHVHPAPPSCNPHQDDWVSAEIVETDGGSGIKVCWEVLETREVQWDASGHSY